MSADGWSALLLRRVVEQCGEARAELDRAQIEDTAAALARLDALRLDDDEVIVAPDEPVP